MGQIKLDWSYDQTHECEIAFLRGYMIKAERGDSVENPFETWDCEWPIHVYAGRDGSWSYPKDAHLLDCVFNFFTDQQLVHDQKAIAAILKDYLGDLRDHCADLEDDEPTPRWMTDECVLRSWFDEAYDCFEGSRRLQVAAELYNLSGVPAYVGETRGYCQGDWAEVLVVATPDQQEKVGCTVESRRQYAIEELMKLDVKTDATENVVDAQAAKLWEKDFEATVDLYGAWAWGDVYGFTIHKPVFDEDGEIEDWEETDSCWGYYGTDHDKSGLEEAALDMVPDEPVRQPDTFQLAHEEAA